MKRVVPFLLVSAVASAQPVTEPTKVVDDQLADIMNDEIKVADPKNKDVAKLLMTEGNKQLFAGHLEQALANFLDAYAKFPSPKILLNIATTLSEMNRFADAANAYQRYLLDPATGTGRKAEVQEQLVKLDAQLTKLTVRVFPRASDLSIDGGPFITVGSSLETRVRPGIHLVRIKFGDKNDELTVNGFEGESKEVAAAIKMEVPPDPPKTAAPVEEVHQAFLDTDYHFTRDEAHPSVISYRPSAEAPSVPPLLVTPHDDTEPPDPSKLVVEDTSISSGAIAVVRIDGKGRGFAGGIGIAIARQRFEGELMLLRSNVTGGYLGGRVRILTGTFRPYVGGGVPIFVFDNDVTNAMTGMMSTETRVAIGLRASGGVEFELNGHLSFQADLGVEHFFNVSGTRYEANAFVPTVGVIGRL